VLIAVTLVPALLLPRRKLEAPDTAAAAEAGVVSVGMH
jgi:hypothetical protein